MGVGTAPIVRPTVRLRRFLPQEELPQRFRQANPPNAKHLRPNCRLLSIQIIKHSIDAEAAKKICAVYDWDGKGELDMFYFMDIFYALGMNLTKKTTVKYGQTDDVEKKFMKFDDVVALMQQAVKEPEHTGNYHDYVELCRLYDKNENGTMMLAELDTF